MGLSKTMSAPGGSFKRGTGDDSLSVVKQEPSAEIDAKIDRFPMQIWLVVGVIALCGAALTTVASGLWMEAWTTASSEPAEGPPRPGKMSPADSPDRPTTRSLVASAPIPGDAVVHQAVVVRILEDRVRLVDPELCVFHRGDAKPIQIDSYRLKRSERGRVIAHLNPRELRRRSLVVVYSRSSLVLGATYVGGDSMELVPRPALPLVVVHENMPVAHRIRVRVSHQWNDVDETEAWERSCLLHVVRTRGTGEQARGRPSEFDYDEAVRDEHRLERRVGFGKLVLEYYCPTKSGAGLLLGRRVVELTKAILRVDLGVLPQVVSVCVAVTGSAAFVGQQGGLVVHPGGEFQLIRLPPPGVTKPYTLRLPDAIQHDRPVTVELHVDRPNLTTHGTKQSIVLTSVARRSGDAHGAKIRAPEVRSVLVRFPRPADEDGWLNIRAPGFRTQEPYATGARSVEVSGVPDRPSTIVLETEDSESGRTLTLSKPIEVTEGGRVLVDVNQLVTVEQARARVVQKQQSRAYGSGAARRRR
jgi:hypothetical protein